MGCVAPGWSATPLQHPASGSRRACITRGLRPTPTNRRRPTTPSRAGSLRGWRGATPRARRFPAQGRDVPLHEHRGRELRARSARPRRRGVRLLRSRVQVRSGARAHDRRARAGRRRLSAARRRGCDPHLRRHTSAVPPRSRPAKHNARSRRLLGAVATALVVAAALIAAISSLSRRLGRRLEPDTRDRRRRHEHSRRHSPERPRARAPEGPGDPHRIPRHVVPGVQGVCVDDVPHPSRRTTSAPAR